MGNYINTDVLPLDVDDSPWLYEKSDSTKGSHSEMGKWMLFYDKQMMNDSWRNATKLFRENKLDGVISMKCSTNLDNPRASSLDKGIIILYCSDSSNEEKIMNIGKKILEIFDYKENELIYYKTDLQTSEGTIATGSNKNHTYKLFNHLYKRKCLIKLHGSKVTLLAAKELPKIERYYPPKKTEKPYPSRYKKSVFEKCSEMITNTELQDDYNKWKSGINYKTNRKIKVGGKIHTELKQKFMIGRPNYRSVLFSDLADITECDYLQETECINNEIDIENASIKEYNALVDSVIENIKKLESWNEFIDFEGKKYGITSKVSNNIHRENDCFGEMVFMCNETEHDLNDRAFCHYDDKSTTYSIYKCCKCGYENKECKESTGGGSQYISKSGFWWK